MTTYNDNFNRANDPTGLGTNWISIAGIWGVISNGAYTNAGPSDNFSVYNATFGNDQYSQAVYLGSTTEQDGTLVRGSTASGYTGYNLYIDPNVRSWQIQRAPGFSTILSGAGPINNNDVIKLGIVGTTITLYQNGASIGSTTDANIASGRPGLNSFTLSVNPAPVFDDWEGSDGTVASIATISWIIA